MNTPERVKLPRFLQQFFDWLSYGHEIWHYLPARLFGAQARMEPTRTYYEGELDDWQVLVIITGPILVGLVGAALTAIFWPANPWTRAKLAVFWAGWFLAARDDFRHAVLEIKQMWRSNTLEK